MKSNANIKTNGIKLDSYSLSPALEKSFVNPRAALQVALSSVTVATKKATTKQ